MSVRLPTLCLLLSLAVSGVGLCAEVPRKPVLSKYQDLWKDSPFTAKPEGSTASVYNPLQDYVLLGVSPIEQGYRVTMINRKRPNDRRLIVESHRPVQGIEIQEVIRKQGDPLATTVRLTRNGNSGVIAFEEKFLTLQRTAATNPRNENPRGGAKAAANQNATNEKSNPPRAPRRRIIPPGTNVQKPKTNGTQNGGQSLDRVLNLPNRSGNRPSGR